MRMATQWIPPGAGLVVPAVVVLRMPGRGALR